MSLSAVLAGFVTIDSLDLVRPVWTTPEFSVSALIGVAVPLLVATLGSQQAPGLGVLRASGYEPRDRLLIGATGLASRHGHRHHQRKRVRGQRPRREPNLVLHS